MNQDLVVTQLNKAALEITGFPSSEILGQPCLEIFRGSLCESHCFMAKSQNGQAAKDVEVEIFRRDGTTRAVAMTTSLLFDSSGLAEGVVVVFRDISEYRLLKEQLKGKWRLANIIGKSQPIQRLFHKIQQVAPMDTTVLIQGESGTGKELVARYAHLYSKRSEGPFIAINCGAFSEGLLVSELFGHEKGAFTGATFLKKGLIEVASKGTLFLDEITEMSPSMQVKLLRVVQEREYQRVGGTEPVKVDVRFIAATNRNIQEVIESGEFRQDLYYRLNVVTLHLPPLSERKGDIPLLCYHFLKKYSSIMGKEVTDISEDMLGVLNSYNFPGNVRELENIIERGIALSKGNTLETIHLPDDLRELSIRTFRKNAGKVPSLEDQEKAYIQWVLKEVGGNKSKAAQILGIDRVSLWRKIKRYDMEK